MVADFSCGTEGGDCINVPKAVDAIFVEFLVIFVSSSSVFKLAIVGVGGAKVVV
jgi:hypothetical protein